ncbi:MAG: DUF2380 domain-containing protein [Gammaproteobacteria bacterium]|nr:DUF2380 domain-containing protein [Gammaproteobacteria bacterium]
MNKYAKLLLICFSSISALLFANCSLAGGQHEIPAVIADFDYYDTSGEARDQVGQHAARMQAFVGILRDSLAAEGTYKILSMNCPESPCSAGSMDPNDFIQTAQQSGARLLIYGGVHKMSTLVQWCKVHVVDLESEKLLLDRTFSFRGDTDMAFRRAAKFIVQTLEDVMPRT